VESMVAGMAQGDPNSIVRRYALRLLPDYGLKYRAVLLAELDDSSYSAAGEALNALGRIDSVAAYTAARAQFGQKSRGTLAEEIVGTLAQYGTEEDFDSIMSRFAQLSFKPRISRKVAAYLGRVQSTARVEKGVDLLVGLRRKLPEFYGPVINDNLRVVLRAKEEAGSTEQADYIRSRLPAGDGARGH